MKDYIILSSDFSIIKNLRLLLLSEIVWSLTMLSSHARWREEGERKRETWRGLSSLPACSYRWQCPANDPIKTPHRSQQYPARWWPLFWHTLNTLYPDMLLFLIFYCLCCSHKDKGHIEVHFKLKCHVSFKMYSLWLTLTARTSISFFTHSWIFRVLTFDYICWMLVMWLWVSELLHFFLLKLFL